LLFQIQLVPLQHGDAVSAVCVPALDQTRLFTGSWDGSVRLWDISRGGGGGGGGGSGGGGGAGGKSSSSSSSAGAGAGAANEAAGPGAAAGETFGSSLNGISRGGRHAGWVRAPAVVSGSAAAAGAVGLYKLNPVDAQLESRLVSTP
jgi:WD40 repeat protein